MTHPLPTDAIALPREVVSDLIRLAWSSAPGIRNEDADVLRAAKAALSAPPAPAPEAVAWDAQTVYDEMDRVSPNWNSYGKSREGAVALALSVVRDLATQSPTPQDAAPPVAERLADAEPPIFDWRTTPIMNPYSRPGTRVVFMGINGHDWQKAEARKFLKVGETYIVRRTEVHSAHTNVWLEGFDADFNSVHFTPAASAALAKKVKP